MKLLYLTWTKFDERKVLAERPAIKVWKQPMLNYRDKIEHEMYGAFGKLEILEDPYKYDIQAEVSFSVLMIYIYLFVFTCERLKDHGTSEIIKFEKVIYLSICFICKKYLCIVMELIE